MPVEHINFTVLRERLLSIVRDRIDNGEYTERGLARLLGISQSQIHNVLKGARTLHADLADRILAKLGLTAQQLLDVSELELGVTLQRESQSWRGRGHNWKHPDATERERLHDLKKPPAANAARAARWLG